MTRTVLGNVATLLAVLHSRALAWPCAVAMQVEVARPMNILVGS